ncbi:hypothetical protein ACFX2C_035773 [Malus domestica]
MTTCCLLHNLIRRHMSADPIKNEILNLDESESSDDDEDMIETVQPTQEWTAWRNTLAMNMYNEWNAQVNKEAEGWLRKSFPLYDRLNVIFGKDRATGV